MNDVTSARKTLCQAVDCVTDDMPDASGKHCIGFLLVAELADEEGGRYLHAVSGTPDGACLLEWIGRAYVEFAADAYDYGDTE